MLTRSRQTSEHDRDPEHGRKTRNQRQPVHARREGARGREAGEVEELPNPLRHNLN